MDLIYDLKEVKNLLIDIYNLTDFRLALFDINFNEILSYPTRLSTFCQTLRNDSHMNDKCLTCDYNAFRKCQKNKQTIQYKCHAGLTEVIIPIISDTNTIIGYIMCGQVFEETSHYSTWNNLKEYLINNNINTQELEDSYNSRPIIPNIKIASLINIIEISTTYLYKCGKLKLDSSSLAYKIDEYIFNNIKTDLDANILCDKFNFHKTKFYQLTKDIYGVGIAKHVRQMRVLIAKQLLLTTDLPIADIAQEVGIFDYNYFTKVFKEEVFCTPSEFRKNYSEIHILRP